ncbi:MAG: c-type cytochrome domain-containing protein [Limisphaerales bacterium]
MAKAPVSFTDNVGYAFKAHCEDCHIKDSKGGLSLATFTAIMKGGENGPVIIPGKPAESILVQLIESDKMPAKSKPLTEEFKTDIREWIAEGAKFDGPDENAKLDDYVIVSEGPEPRGGGGGGSPGGRSRGNNWNPFTRFDKNGDEKLTKDEVEGPIKERFDEFDTDKDGNITSEEFNARMESRSGGNRGATNSAPQRPPFEGQTKKQ